MFDVHSSSWAYTDIDWRIFIPTQDELTTMIKNIILKYKDNPGRYDDGWFDDDTHYITRDGALSDYELFERVMFQTRVHLVPYKSFSRVSIDLSYSSHVFEETINHRFYLINGEIKNYGGCDYDKQDLPNYNLYNEDFISWLRETLKVPNKEIDSDEEVLKNGIEQFLDSYLWYGKKEYNWKTKIKNFKDWKSFKNDYLGFMKIKNINNNGSSSLLASDGYRGSLNYYSNKYGITILQDKKLRMKLNREIIPTDYNDDSLVYELKGDEVFKKAYELFGSSIKQLSLLDFM